MCCRVILSAWLLRARSDVIDWKPATDQTWRQCSWPGAIITSSVSRSLNFAGRNRRPLSSSFGVWVPVKNIGHSPLKARRPPPAAPFPSTALHSTPLCSTVNHFHGRVLPPCASPLPLDRRSLKPGQTGHGSIASARARDRLWTDEVH